MSMIYKDKHLNYFVAGVPNLNIKFFKSQRCLAREKEDKKMAKRTAFFTSTANLAIYYTLCGK